MCGILIVQNPYCNQMPNAETITSAANPLLKDVRRAIGARRIDPRRAVRRRNLPPARRGAAQPVRGQNRAAGGVARKPRVGRLRGRARGGRCRTRFLQSLSGTESAQGVIALVKPPVWTIDDLFRGRPLVVVLDGVQDPGNAGTIVRAAEAFGATGARVSEGQRQPA